MPKKQITLNPNIDPKPKFKWESVEISANLHLESVNMKIVLDGDKTEISYFDGETNAPIHSAEVPAIDAVKAEEFKETLLESLQSVIVQSKENQEGDFVNEKTN